MKSSQYNLTSEINTGYLLFNTISEEYSIVNKNILHSLLNEDFSSISEKSLIQLKEGGFIINKDTDEYKSLKDEYNNAIFENNYHLILLPTLDCNVRCWYCFEKKEKGSHLAPMMSDIIFKHIENKIESSPEIDKYTIELFGGEPLLYFEKEVYPLLEKIQELLKTHNKKCKFFIVTNGIAIEEKQLPLFKKLEASFQISIDGCKERHDKIKRVKGEKQSTYDKVMRNINLLANHYNSKITIRINYDNETLPSVTNIIEDIKDVDRNKVLIHLERVWQTIDKKDEEDNELLFSVIVEFLKNKFRINYMNFFRKSYSCKTSKKNQAIISYNGSVYKCTGRDFEATNKDGVILSNGTIKWNSSAEMRLAINTFDNDDTCKKCKLLPLCWGICCQKIMENQSVSSSCQLKDMEFSIEKYLFLRFNSKLNEINNLESSINI